MYTCPMKTHTETNAKGQQVLENIRSIGAFLPASMTISKKKCGNSKYRCAKQGPIHETALLTWKEGNTTKTLHVPRELRAEAAARIAHIVTQLLDKGCLLRKRFPRGFGPSTTRPFASSRPRATPSLGTTNITS